MFKAYEEECITWLNKAKAFHDTIAEKKTYVEANLSKYRGMALVKLKDYEGATKCFEYAIQVLEASSKWRVAEDYEEMGKLLVCQKKISESLQYFNKCHAIYEKTYGKEHSFTKRVSSKIEELAPHNDVSHSGEEKV